MTFVVISFASVICWHVCSAPISFTHVGLHVYNKNTNIFSSKMTSIWALASNTGCPRGSDPGEAFILPQSHEQQGTEGEMPLCRLCTAYMMASMFVQLRRGHECVFLGAGGRCEVWSFACFKSVRTHSSDHVQLLKNQHNSTQLTLPKGRTWNLQNICLNIERSPDRPSSSLIKLIWIPLSLYTNKAKQLNIRGENSRYT